MTIIKRLFMTAKIWTLSKCSSTLINVLARQIPLWTIIHCNFVRYINCKIWQVKHKKKLFTTRSVYCCETK